MTLEWEKSFGDETSMGDKSYDDKDVHTKSTTKTQRLLTGMSGTGERRQIKQNTQEQTSENKKSLQIRTPIKKIKFNTC